ncbi:MAG: ABC transporter permease [Flavobacteriaceae bacterium]|nr:ABC transporter permease [Flavobacteriaceae bacterium]|tara:strand:- start:8388 stop:9596 length:1209 start_codon:yes stop_codon:yes gene_type:complete
MTYVFKIAFRYFFSKNEQTVINKINFLSLILIIISSASLFIVLSAFDGLKTFGLSFSNKFDADYELSPLNGKYLKVSPEIISEINNLEEIVEVAPQIEEKVFLSFKEKNQVAVLKGVDSSYNKVIPIKDLVMIGDWIDNDNSKTVIGYGISSKLGLGVYDYSSFLKISVPRNNNSSVLNLNPFKSLPLIVVGLYQINEELDNKYIFTSLSFAKNLLNLKENQYSNLIIKTIDNINKKKLEEKINLIVEEKTKLTSRLEKNAALFKMLNTENIAVYFIFSLVMIISLFNLVGSLIMMILNKKKEMKILIAMGVSNKNLSQIFYFIGLIICFVGGIIGLSLGSLLVFIQKYSSIINVPGTNLSYPVEFNIKNIIVVFLTLIILGSISSLWSIRGIKKISNQAMN